MSHIETGEQSSEHRGELLRLRAGQQRVARAQAQRHVVPDSDVKLLLEDREVGTASGFSVDDSGDLHARIDVEERLDIAGFDCQPIWRFGRLVRFVLRRRLKLTDDETGAWLIDDETQERIYNG